MNEEAANTTTPRKHRAVIAAVLAAALATAMTVVGISAASSTPNDGISSTTISHGATDQGQTSEFSPDDCEQYAQEHGWSGHGDMNEMMGDSGFMNSMSGGDWADMGTDMGNWADTGTMGSMGSMGS